MRSEPGMTKSVETNFVQAPAQPELQHLVQIRLWQIARE